MPGNERRVLSLRLNKKKGLILVNEKKNILTLMKGRRHTKKEIKLKPKVGFQLVIL